MGYRDEVLSYDQQKYEYLEDKKLLFLFSGNPAPIEDFKPLIRKYAKHFLSRLEIYERVVTAKNLFDSCCNVTPAPKGGWVWEVLACGFYEKTPQIAIFNSSIDEVIPCDRGGVIGAPDIVKILGNHVFEFDDVEESQVIEKLGNIIKETMVEENKKNGTSRQTGGPINRLILSVDGLEPLEPIPFP